MSDELFPFDDVRMDSPKLAWMKKHGVRVVQHDWTGTDFEGSDEPRWQAVIGGYRNPHYCIRMDTEDEAIEEAAMVLGVPLWNEDDAK